MAAKDVHHIHTKSLIAYVLYHKYILNKTHTHARTHARTHRGGATVLKVGGTNCASGASRKFFLTPHFLASGGDKILLT